MLKLIVPGVESFDDKTQTFVYPADDVIELEHSLRSLSKWESQWEKPFLSSETKSTEEVFSYIKAMSVSGEIPDEVLYRLTDDHIRTINDYLESKMTATWFNDADKPRGYNSEVITAEVMYHWIVALQINWEVETWHLNRLITLVKTINEKNKAASDTKKKAPTSGDLANRRALMAKRRAEAGGRG